MNNKISVDLTALRKYFDESLEEFRKVMEQYTKIIKRRIIIYDDGKTVYAEFKVNGKTVKMSMARCHPDDRYNFETGARIAFDRLFEKKKKKKKLITLREKLAQEHPKCINDECLGGCEHCPRFYGYSEKSLGNCEGASEENCRKCWDEYYIPKEDKK